MNDLLHRKIGRVFRNGRPCLSSYERDIRDPDTASLKKLAEFYEVSTDFLLGMDKGYSSPKHPLDPVIEDFLNDISIDDYPFLHDDIENDVSDAIKTMLLSSLNVIKRLKDDEE
ncbi:helix-turn-helix transcriptional regulator [Shouchella miscanthi]|uniref:Helix-turn-helix transcriptional regulator n=1 Tax=Shouchella miscanthi TaxID=2598861 RepID=A0ABU6NF98_9BACI|nr:helix-turn-helix transcriptional regulator [Shouchella miscanthi]